jgi:hypothetical protein
MQCLSYAIILTVLAALGNNYLTPVATAPQLAPGKISSGTEAFQFEHPETLLNTATQSI